MRPHDTRAATARPQQQQGHKKSIGLVSKTTTLRVHHSHFYKLPFPCLLNLCPGDDANEQIYFSCSLAIGSLHMKFTVWHGPKR